MNITRREVVSIDPEMCDDGQSEISQAFELVARYVKAGYNLDSSFLEVRSKGFRLPRLVLTRSLPVQELGTDQDTQEASSNVGLLTTKVSNLGLGGRAYRGLLNAKVGFVGELVQCKPEELRRVKNLGRKSLKEIEEKVASLGLSLGLSLSSTVVQRCQMACGDFQFPVKVCISSAS